jgi:hypothetical protein
MLRKRRKMMDNQGFSDPSHATAIFAAMIVALIGVLFWWPLISYAYHYWLG